MNIIKLCEEIFDTDENTSEESDFFEYLYEIKKYGLMAENYYGENINRGQMTNVNSRIEQISSVQTLGTYAKAVADCIRNTIPEELRRGWENADYEEYTDKYHHRRFWSEIENHPIIDRLLKRFCDLNRYETDGKRAITTEKNWNLCLYDFNNYDIYFSSETEVNAFASMFDPVPYTVYRYENGYWAEQYTV